MTESEPSNDPDGGADDSAGAGGEAAGRDHDRRVKPVLVDASEADSEDQSVNDPEPLREPEPIEPESPRAENALFVLLGVLGTVALLATAIVPGLL